MTNIFGMQDPMAVPGASQASPFADIALQGTAGAGAAGGGALGSLMGFLGTPGLGSALMAGAMVLTSLFGQRRQADMQRFQIEVQKQQDDLNRAQRRTSESQAQIGQAFNTGIAAEGQRNTGTLNALRGFF